MKRKQDEQTVSQEGLKQTLAHLRRSLCLKLLYKTSKHLFGKGFSEGTLNIFIEREGVLNNCDVVKQDCQDREEKQQQNYNQNNSENTTKTHHQNSVSNSLKTDGKCPSNSARGYYQELLDRHPEWKALDEERKNPEY